MSMKYYDMCSPRLTIPQRKFSFRIDHMLGKYCLDKNQTYDSFTLTINNDTEKFEQDFLPNQELSIIFNSDVDTEHFKSVVYPLIQLHKKK